MLDTWASQGGAAWPRDNFGMMAAMALVHSSGRANIVRLGNSGKYTPAFFEPSDLTNSATNLADYKILIG